MRASEVVWKVTVIRFTGDRQRIRFLCHTNLNMGIMDSLSMVRNLLFDVPKHFASGSRIRVEGCLGQTGAGRKFDFGNIILEAIPKLMFSRARGHGRGGLVLGLLDRLQLFDL